MNALTGRDLYALDLTLFVDDEGALDFDDEVDIADGAADADAADDEVQVCKEWGTGNGDAAPARPPPAPPSSSSASASAAAAAAAVTAAAEDLYLDDDCELPDC